MVGEVFDQLLEEAEVSSCGGHSPCVLLKTTSLNAQIPQEDTEKYHFGLLLKWLLLILSSQKKKKYVSETLRTFRLNMQLLSALGNFEFQLIMCQSSPKLHCFCSPLSWHMSGGSRQYHPAKKLRTATVHYTLCIKGWTVKV